MHQKRLHIQVLALLVLLLCARCASGQTGVLVLTPGSSTTLTAGSGKHGLSGDGHAAALASMASPSAVVYSANGDLYVADSGNHVIRRITADGTISTIAGNGVQGFSGDGGPATQASLDTPQGLAITPDGALFIADSHNQRIRRVAVTGTITTVAGSGSAGFSGDGGDAIAARLRNPLAVAVGLAGEIYIADSGNHRIRRLARDGTITTVAGNGVESSAGDGGQALQASLDTPTGVAVRPDGALLIADRGNDKVRVVLPTGMISTLPTGSQTLRRASGVSAASDGSVYVSDTGQHQVRQVATDGMGTILGSGQEGVYVSGSPQQADISTPVSTASDNAGGLAVADSRNGQVYHIDLPRLSFRDTPLGAESTPVLLRLQNAGSADLKITAITLPENYLVNESGTCAAAPLTLPAAGGCTLAITFHPSTAGSSAGLLGIAVENGLTQRALLTGTALPSISALPSSVILQAAAALTYAGTPLQLNTSVVTQFSAAPSGFVTYLDGGKEIGTSTLNSSGNAQFSINSLSVGTHTLTARYSGDTHYQASISSAVQQVIVAIPDFSLVPAVTTLSVARGSSATASFTLQPVNGTLNRSVALQLSGLPSEISVNISPSPANLGSDPVHVDVVLKAPATLAALEKPLPFAVCGLLLVFRRRRLQALLALCLTCVLQGCGGGYLNGNGPSASTSRNYTVTVTATTTSITGDPLIHATAFTLTVN